MLTARDIMTENVVTVRPAASIREATTNLNPFWWQTISKKVQGEACQRHGPILYSN